MESKSQLVDFLEILTADENDYFERSFEALDVPEAEYTDPELTPETQAFEDLLERAAREGGYAETLAVLLPAEWIYLEWANTVEGESPSRFYLAEWIDLHANERGSRASCRGSATNSIKKARPPHPVVGDRSNDSSGERYR